MGSHWAFLACIGYLEYEWETGKPYYDLMELIRSRNYHTMTTNQDFQFIRVVPEEKLSTIQGEFHVYPGAFLESDLTAFPGPSISLSIRKTPSCPRR